MNSYLFFIGNNLRNVTVQKELEFVIQIKQKLINILENSIQRKKDKSKNCSLEKQSLFTGE